MKPQFDTYKVTYKRGSLFEDDMCNHKLERITTIRSMVVCLKCQSIDGSIGVNVIRVSDAAMSKLRLLAYRRNMTIDQCVEAFAMSCQPSGDSWIHPSKVR